MRNLLCVLVSLFLVVAVTGSASAALLTDDFNTVGSAANYNQVSTTADVVVTHGFDYGASPLFIPVAPHTTDGSRLGLKLEANVASPASVEAVTLHTVQQFSGAYIVQFDAWINSVGVFPAGGAGSSEALTAGVGGNGTAVNRTAATVTGSGAWTSVSGDGGLARDYQMFKDASEQFGESGQFAAGNTTANQNAADAYYNVFGNINVADLGQGQNNGGPASQSGTTQSGAAGFAWHTITLVTDPTGGTGGAASVIWSIDGLRIGTLDAGIGSAFGIIGSVTLGYSDPASSLSGNNTYTFGLIDNLVVEAIPEPGAWLFGLVGTIGAGVCSFVRRRQA